MRFYFEHLWMAISSSENRRNVRREVQCDGVRYHIRFIFAMLM